MTDRFWAKVNRDGGPSPVALGSCWLWQGALAQGYGRFNLGGRIIQAHRLAYELLIGPIPEGLHIDHLCLNRRCVNPNHLELVTPAENTRRHFASRQTCPNGHPYSEENVYRHRGRRLCRACRRIADQRRRNGSGWRAA